MLIRRRAIWNTTNFGAGRILSLTALLAPIIGMVATNGIAPLLAVSAVALLISKRMIEGAWPAPPKFLTVYFSVFLGWALLSSIWSIDPAQSLEKLPRFLLLHLAGLILVDAALNLNAEQCRSLINHLAAGLVIGILIMFADRVTDGHLRQLLTRQDISQSNILNFYNRPATLIVLFVWPILARFAQIHIALAILLWLLALGVVMSLISGAALLAIVLGGVAFVLVAVSPTIGRAVLAVLLAISVLVAPILPPSHDQAAHIHKTYTDMPRSGYHRLLIWRFVADRIEERPILGWGFNSSRAIPGNKKQLDESEQALPLHPHNAALQFWLELGLPGAILGAALLLLAMHSIGREGISRLHKGCASGLIVSAATVCFLSFGIWQSWWLASLWFAATFMIAIPRVRTSVTEPEQL